MGLGEMVKCWENWLKSGCKKAAIKEKAAQPQMFFSVPFWTPKRNWGVGQSPTATA